LRVRRPGLDLGHVAFPSHRLVPDFRDCRLGEYVGKIYFETKARPRDIVEEEIGIVPAMPESEIVRNRTEATQTSRNGYSRVSM